MTLTVLDETGKEITDANPLITEHNGETGGSVTLPLTLKNKSSSHYYKNIRLQVNSVSPVLAQLLIIGEHTPNYLPVKKIERFDKNAVLPINLQLTIGPGTPEQVVTGIKLIISSMKYPSPD